MAEHNIASVAQLDNLSSEVGAVKEQLDTINLKLDNDTQNTKKTRGLERVHRGLVREQLDVINLKLKNIVNGNEDSASRDTKITELLENLATHHSCSMTDILGKVYEMREAISANLKTDGILDMGGGGWKVVEVGSGGGRHLLVILLAHKWRRCLLDTPLVLSFLSLHLSFSLSLPSYDSPFRPPENRSIRKRISSGDERAQHRHGDGPGQIVAAARRWKRETRRSANITAE
jgi:hypothetical protein